MKKKKTSSELDKHEGGEGIEMRGGKRERLKIDWKFERLSTEEWCVENGKKKKRIRVSWKMNVGR